MQQVPHLGETLAVLTSFLWAGTAVFFTAAGRHAGSQAVNFARLPLAVLCLGAANTWLTGHFWPIGVSLEAMGWLALSGVVGLTLGDSFLFWAFGRIGPRRTLLMMSTAPVFTVLTAWLLLGERLDFRQLIGVVVIIAGVMLATLGRDEGGGVFRNLPRSVLRSGFLAGLAAGACQGVGATFAKLGMAALEPLQATMTRMIWGAIGMTAVALVSGKLVQYTVVWKDRRALPPLLGGVIMGPFLGVWASLAAFKLTDTGVAMALAGTVPVTVLIPSWIVYHDRPSLLSFAGVVVAVAGGAILFL